MRREFSSGRRLRFNRRGQWVSPFFDSVSSLTVGPKVNDEVWDSLRDALTRSEPAAK